MNVGKMRHQITFIRPANDKDRLGGYEEDYVDVATVWAQVSPVSGKEHLSQVRETTVSHKIYCRYREGITPQLRVRFKGRIFKILSVINWEERNEGLTLLCEECVHEQD